MRFREIIEAGRQLQEQEVLAEAAVAYAIADHYIGEYRARDAARSWDRALRAISEPGAARPAHAGSAIGRRWDRILAECAPVRESPQRTADRRRSSMTVVPPSCAAERGPIATLHNVAIAASWDAALAPYAAANGEPPQ